ncbi:CdaR family transcriptional regulator [Bacillus sp. FJAT-29814]|uniref:PucR family transcriptional regulator n=1 Tax=Bacillus sp. FJAT-29814 TaxID=1729688 RepID=UPI0008342D0F|nr:helix-turn-helix domain-containing protein [Bacillus sp. FJAT-29814]
MLKKLLSLFSNSVMLAERPKQEPQHQYVFFDEAAHEWIGIPKTEISEQELLVLKTLYQLIDFQPTVGNTASGKWHEFLLFDGPPPSNPSDHEYRFVQFQINGHDINQPEIEDALKGFFTEDTIIFWESRKNGVVIEGKKQISLSDGELISMSETLESDFYVKISFYVGKLYPLTEMLPSIYKKEREYFAFAVRNLGNNSRLFTYERIFPAYLAAHLPKQLAGQIPHEIFELFAGDPELYTTIKVFLENNLNASTTAKKLYIHRNTLQYRLDKFTERTGIGLKDFYGAFTVFLACQLFEHTQQ